VKPKLVLIVEQANAPPMAASGKIPEMANTGKTEIMPSTQFSGLIANPMNGITILER